MITFRAQGCFAKRLEILSRMSTTLAPGKHYVSADLLLTCLIIESLITRVVGEAARGGADCAHVEGADEGEWSEEQEEEESRRAGVKFGFEWRDVGQQ